MLYRRVITAALLLLAAACTETVELGPGKAPSTCVAGGAQCNDCEDNDNDGKIDGFDPECTGALDDDEGSFATGIPGDNQNGTKQDCFFDGNSGSGNDGCDLHVCCILDLRGGPCPAEFQPPAFDPAECVVSDRCIETCAPLAPPGCDCFGCCTVCGAAGCADIFISPVLSPDCGSENIEDPEACQRCVKNEACGAPCDPEACILCPGQSAEDLPAGCEPTCPAQSKPCGGSVACLSGEFCANGCCVGIPQ